MAIVALVSLIVICLTVGRGWVGDLVGQLALASAIGMALAEGIRRSICNLLHNRVWDALFCFAPLTLFGFHAYAVANADRYYWYSMTAAAVISLTIWLVMAFHDFCANVVAGMNDCTARISQNGG